MEPLSSIFALFGGIRPMARALGESPSKVHGWKKGGHIPAQKQAEVLEKGVALGLPLTTDHVVFPLGRPGTEIADVAPSVPCDQQSGMQQKAARK